MRRLIPTLLTAVMAFSAIALAPAALAAPALKTVRPKALEARPMPETTGDVTVAYYAAGGEAKAISTARGKGAELEKRAPSLGAVVVEPPAGVSPAEFAAEMEKTPGIRYAEPVRPMRALYTPNDQYFSEQWGLMLIHMPTAWEVTRGSSDVTVAVVDTGFDFGITEQPISIDTVNDRDFTVDPPSTTAQDDDGHGTAMAGIVAAATDNGSGIAGIAPNVTILPIRALDGVDDNDVDVSEGIKWAADRGADVISLSVGGPEGSTMLENAVDYAIARGCVVVAAAGNEADDPSYTPGDIYYPAAYPQVIAVGAVDQAAERAPFSQYGPGLDLVGPGVRVLALDLDNWAVEMNGTSPATPHVAGVAALLRSVHPAWSATMVTSALSAAAEDLGPLGRDDYYGHGLVRADRATNMVGTYVGLEGAPTNPSWGYSARMVGTLWSDAESFLATRPVSIEAKPYGASSWAEVATATTDADGVYRASVRPSKRTAYRVYFSGEAGVVQAYSASKTITPKAYLTMPSRPRLVYAGRTFWSAGYVKPWHTPGAKSVAIRCYKWSSSLREYRYHHTAWATNGQYTAAGTRYSGRVRLPHKGKWKLVARVTGDSMHVTTYSSHRYVYAR